MSDWPIREVAAGGGAGLVAAALVVAAAVRRPRAARPGATRRRRDGAGHRMTGGLASPGSIAVAAAGSRTRRAPLPVAGAAFVVAGCVALAVAASLSVQAVVGVVGVGMAIGVAGRWRRRSWVGAVLAVPFAALVAGDGQVAGAGWVRAGIVVAAAAGGALAAAADARRRCDPLGPPLLAMTTVGVALVVPDTEHAAALVGAAAAIGLLGWPAGMASLGRGGAAGAVALVTWVGAVGAAGRPASFVGAVACLGLLLAGPGGGARPAPVLVVHAAIVLVASRVIGRGDDAATAAAAAVVLAPVAVWAAATAGRSPSP